MSRRVIRYSESFKQQVVDSIESGLTIKEAKLKYGILGEGTIQIWIRKKGKLHLLPKVVRVQDPKEVDRIRALESKIKSLEKALVKAQVREVLSDSFLEIACENLGENVESFKKKVELKQSKKR